MLRLRRAECPKANCMAERNTWRGKAKREKQGVEGPENRKGTGAKKTPHIEYSLGGSVVTERLYMINRIFFFKKKYV